jgi:hypothetical protein
MGHKVREGHMKKRALRHIHVKKNYCMYNTIGHRQGGTPVLQQSTAVLPVPDRETVGKIFTTGQEQKQLANRA